MPNVLLECRLYILFLNKNFFDETHAARLVEIMEDL